MIEAAQNDEFGAIFEHLNYSIEAKYVHFFSEWYVKVDQLIFIGA